MKLTELQIEQLKQRAEGGEVKAQLKLGQMYLDGNGVEENHTEAARWYQLAAGQGDRGGISSLAALYFTGWGVEYNPSHALELYCQAADMGDKHSALSAARMLLEGTEVAKDASRAASLLQSVLEDADEHIKPNTPEAQAAHLLGIMYNTGNGVEQDKVKSWKTLERASEAGVKPATVLMQSFPIEELQQIASGGSGAAALVLGQRYVQGIGVERDCKLAYELFKQAAESGQVGAYNNLGIMLEYGDGVKRDLAAAYENYKRAASMGHTDAQKSMNRVGNMLTQGKDKTGCSAMFGVIAIAFLIIIIM